MSDQDSGLNFRESRIPERLAPAADVTEEEYREARIHQLLVFLVTGVGLLTGWYGSSQNWFELPIAVPESLTLPLIFGLVFHVVSRYVFRKAALMKTPRLRMYPEYKQFKHASEAFARDADSKKSSEE